jgi:Na+/H+ antiporter NhaC
LLTIRNIKIIILAFSLVFPLPALASSATPDIAATWLAILPPLVAILVALIYKRVIPALFTGVLLGAWLIEGLTVGGFWRGLLSSFEVYVVNSLADRDNAAIILFSMMIGGMVGIISRNGGMQGIVNGIVRWADSVRHASLATAAMGLAVFFDDYANTLVVGNTMRPVTDANRVSREKLAYIVDSTAAPVACIALVTTWIGYEVGLIGDALQSMPGIEMDAYLLLLNTIPYSFYPILAVLFVFMVAATGRDFGPMLAAEQAARTADGASRQLEDVDQNNDSAPITPVEDKPHRAINAIVPVAVLILGVLGGLYFTGRVNVEVAEPSLRDIIGAADSYRALLWASFLGVLTAAVLSLGQRILDLEETVDAWYRGLRSMLMALIILLLAWALGETTEILETADFLVSVLGDSLPAFAVPALVFILAAITAFATGSSWGAMGILIPLVMPLTWAVLKAQGLDGPEHLHILYSAISAVLAGAVWGDHCSPISDTTILSSLASGCEHIEHVRTQLPYAFLVGITGLLTGTLPVALGMPWWLGIGLGAIILYTMLRLFGTQTDQS